MIKEHDRVVLKSSVLEQALIAIDDGTVVHVHRKGEAFKTPERGENCGNGSTTETGIFPRRS
ncbi:MAG TPA: hypothetical protein VI585_26205 [Candidatus Binatia bacterium]